MRTFASDNNSGIHPSILKAIEEANNGHVIAYGDDPYTERALKKFKELFGEESETFFVTGGTAANVLSLRTITQSFNSIICASSAHINVHEGGATEKNAGCKLITIPTVNGKITVEQIAPLIGGIGDQHSTQAKVISITQPTEVGTLYSPEEIKEIADFAHKNNMLLHMDGARIANAVASLGVDIKDITAKAGVDVLSFGGIKNGMMFGEAVVFFKKDLAKNFKFVRMQGLNLIAKMRFVAAQFEALLTDNLWLKNAQHSNDMARLLAQKLKQIPEVKVTQDVQVNGVFALLPKKIIKTVQEKCFFYVWNEKMGEVRLMTSFDTQEEDIDNFVKLVKETIAKG